MEITWLSQGSFLFESDGARILIDPYMSDCLEFKGLKRLVDFPLTFEELRPDILICTHDHLDHLDPGTVREIAALYPECLIAGPVSCCRHFRKLEIPEKSIKKLECGKVFELNGTKITPVFALHTEPEATGLLIEAGGKRVYLSGDTEYDDKLINDFTRGCDLLLICINGRLGNMSLEKALKVAENIKPRIALPMHYGLFAENTADPKPFIAGCVKAGIKSFEMFVGGGFEL
jgi:L-ascorbate metabolism protein UlaG (beta-lactamase superfamily)